MIKKLLIVFVSLLTISSFAQESTASPYSFYGIGSLKFKGTVENRSMGGLSIYTDSIHVNLRNPASLAGANLTSFNNEGRPVKYTIGSSYSSINLKEADGNEEKTSATSFDYLALSFPVGKFGVGFGILPYTAVGYKLEAVNDAGEVANRFNGEGGLNKVFLGLGYMVNDKLNIGLDVSYNFGNIQNSALEVLFDDDGTAIFNQTRENNRSDLSGLSVNLGATYKTMISKTLQLTTGVTYTPKSKIKSINQRSLSTIVLNSSGQEFSGNTSFDVDLDAIGLAETELVLPSKFTIGGGIGEPRKWFVGVESVFQKTSDFENPLYAALTTNYKDAYSLALGGFYIPQYNSFSSYFKRIVYRAGFRVEETGLSIQNESINEFGMSFGVGLPIGTFFSNANLGVEIGKRGTTNSNLIQENFVNFQISLSLNDRWFQKRKYD